MPPDSDSTCTSPAMSRENKCPARRRPMTVPGDALRLTLGFESPLRSLCDAVAGIVEPSQVRNRRPRRAPASGPANLQALRLVDGHACMHVHVQRFEGVCGHTLSASRALCSEDGRYKQHSRQKWRARVPMSWRSKKVYLTRALPEVDTCYTGAASLEVVGP